MPTSKSINAYPLHLYAVVEEVLTTKRPIEVPMGSKREAMALRLQAYGLRRALMNAPEHALSDEAAKLTMSITPTNILILSHMDSSVPEGLRRVVGDL